LDPTLTLHKEKVPKRLPRRKELARFTAGDAAARQAAGAAEARAGVTMALAIVFGGQVITAAALVVVAISVS
jgi:hypothetical protein